MIPCLVCASEDRAKCDAGRAEFAAEQERRRAILERHGIRTFRIPVGGVHEDWKVIPDDRQLLAFLESLPAATPPPAARVISFREGFGPVLTPANHSDSERRVADCGHATSE